MSGFPNAEPRAARIAAPRWYAEAFGEPFVPLDEAAAEAVPRPMRRLARRPGFLQGVAIGIRARRGRGAALVRRERGTITALLVAGLPPRRPSVYVLELIRRPLPRPLTRRPPWWLWWRLAEGPALRRGMAGGHVMTAWERDEYASHYAIDPDRLDHVRWGLTPDEVATPAPVRPGDRTVLASGRTACDWPTVFAAAAGANWELTVVCSRRDLPMVEALNRDRQAAVRCEIPRGEHVELLRASAVYALVLEDRGLSAGHVRLASAVDNGIPVVASAVPALDGYAVDGETAVLVPPGDPAALRDAIDSLLADPEGRRGLRDAARRRAASWRYEDYFRALRRAVEVRLAAAGR